MNEVIDKIKQHRKNKRQSRYYRSKLDPFADEIVDLYKNKIFISEIGNFLRKKKINKKCFCVSDTQISRWIKKNEYINLRKKDNG